MSRRILALDTEPETVEHLRKAGLEVVTAEVGYRTAKPSFNVAPHEFDLILCDLKKPAIFSMDDWGRGTSNSKFTPAEPGKRMGYFIDKDKKKYPLLRIVMESQLEHLGRTTFGPEDVFRAIERAGIPAILLLNPEWIKHVVLSSPNIFGMTWRFRETRAERVIIENTLTEGLPLAGTTFRFKTPFLWAIDGGANRPSFRSESLPSRQIVSNVVHDVFGQYIRVGKGAVWALPPFVHNGELLLYAIEQLDNLRSATHHYAPAFIYPTPPPDPLPDMVPKTDKEAESDVKREETSRDLFICHASEDKEHCARPLVKELRTRGVTVWFDESELRIGDSLRRKIDEGLKMSRHGLVLLSHTFFNKDWPQKELDALASLSDSGKRILPVWIDVNEDDINRYSPTLAGVYAAKWKDGIDSVVEAILRSLRD